MTLRDQLIRDEGKRHTAYSDSLGNATIGVGHNLRVPISDAAIDRILDDDIAAVEEELTLVLPGYTSLSDARRGVLANMAFNMGVHGLLQFHRVLAAVADGQWEAAARHMLDSRWSSQVGDRAVRLAEQMRTDTWI